MSTESEIASGWKSKGEAERKRILAVVHEAAKLNASWKRTAAMLGIHQKTLHRWRKDDEEGKLETAREVGRAEAGKTVMGYMMDVASNPEAQGRSAVLIHLSKHMCEMGDKSTNVNVDVNKPADGSGEGEIERYNRGLDILGLGALAIEAPAKEGDSDED